MMKLDDVTPDTSFREAALLVFDGEDQTHKTYRSQLRNVVGLDPALADRPLRDIQDADVRAAFPHRPRGDRGVYVRVYNALAYEGLIPSDMSDLSKSAHRELSKGGHMATRRARLIAERAGGA